MVTSAEFFTGLANIVAFVHAFTVVATVFAHIIRSSSLAQVYPTRTLVYSFSRAYLSYIG